MRRTLYKYVILLTVLFSILNCTSQPGVVGESTSPSESNGFDWTVSFNAGLGVLTNPSLSDISVNYGHAIAVGDWNNDGHQDVAISAPLADIRNTNSGSVFIYYGGSAGNSSLTEVASVRLENPNGLNSLFGTALLSTDNNGDGIDDLIIGAEQDDRGPNNDNEGTVYFYYGSTQGLSSIPGQVLDEPDGNRDDGFGTSLAAGDMDGDGLDELIVGTRLGDVGGGDRGVVWIFAGQPNGIYNPALNVSLRDSGAANTEYFGQAVQLFDYDNDGNLDLFVGASREDSGGADRGAVHIYLGTGVPGAYVASTVTPSTTITNSLASNTSYFGFSINFADIDNDGTADMLVGTPLSDFGPTNSGSVRIYKDIRASVVEDGFINQPNLSLTGDSFYGQATAVADLNGDGALDLLVGAVRADDFGRDRGRVDVFYGTTTGDWDLAIVDRVFSPESLSQPRVNASNDFGSAACSGDFNGDGVKDLAIGAQFDDGAITDEGRIYLYYTKSDGRVLDLPDEVITPGGVATGRRFGSNCVSFDFDRDGFNDLLVGAFFDDAGPGNDSGSVYIFSGTSAGLSTSPSAIILNPSDGADGFGASLGYGDLNNDGFNDLVVGSPLNDQAGADRGAVFIYVSNNITGVIDTSVPLLFATGAVDDDHFGEGVAVVDKDGDGDDDLFVGIPLDDSQAGNSGRVISYTNLGVANNLIGPGTFTFIDNPTAQANSSFGEYLMADYFSSQSHKDLFIGAPDDDISSANGGALFIYEGDALGIPSSPSRSIRDLDSVAPANESLGSAAAVLDINLDGILDLVIGAENDDRTGINSGSAYILLGQ